MVRTHHAGGGRGGWKSSHLEKGGWESGKDLIWALKDVCNLDKMKCARKGFSSRRD